MCLVNIIRTCTCSVCCVFVSVCVIRRLAGNMSIALWASENDFTFVCVWYTILGTIKLSYLVAIWILCKYEISSFTTTFFQNLWFYVLIFRGVPSLIIAQTQVSFPLNSWPVDGYRKAGATPICIYRWSPARSGSWDMLSLSLEHVG